MLDRYGSFVYRRARLILVLSAVAFIAAAVLGAGAFGKLKNGGFDDPATESSRAEQLIDANFGGGTNLVLLVHAVDGSVDAPAARDAGAAITRGLQSESMVDRVVSYWSTGAPGLRSADGRYAIVAAHIIGDRDQVISHGKEVIDRYTGDRGAVTVQASGNAATNVDVRAEVGKSLAIAEGIAVPLTILLLILAFGSLVAASLPLAIGAVAIVGTFAELYILGSVTDVSVFAINLTTALGLGLSIDYALLLVSRFREQLGAGAEVPDAVRGTVATAGRTIAFSAAAVAAALAALLVFPQFFLRSFAYAGVGVVAISAVAALVVVPALLSVLGHRVNKGSLPWARKARGPESALWGRIAGAVTRRPVLAAVPVVAALLFAASPLLNISFGTPDIGVLPPGAESRQAAETIRTTFPGSDGNAVDVVSTSPVSESAWSGYASQLSRLTTVDRVDTAGGSYVDGQRGPGTPDAASLASPTGQRLRVVSSLEPKSDAAQDLVASIRAVDPPSGATTLVGGEDARLTDSKSSMAEHLPAAFGLIALTTFVLLFLFTGSVLQPLRALVLNALSLGAALGIVTWIFQDGHLSGWLGFTPRPMDTSMTMLLFCIAFGLSMDYELFLTSRIKELHDRGASTAVATREGLARTGRIVSTAAALLAVSFIAFGTASVSFLQMFGIGTALAILIDATLVRGVLVPVAMRLLGRAAWWAPQPLRRVYARVGLSEA